MYIFMQLNHKNILLISPEPWNHIFVSKHHYATHLGLRNNKVYFLNPPANKEEVITTAYENVWQVNYKGFPKGLRYYPESLQKYFTKCKFEKLQELCEIKFDIIWSFDNSVFYDFSALPKCLLKISHIVDLNQNFQMDKAANTADLCFGVCTPIVEKLKTYNINSFFINHGGQPCIKEGKVSLPGTNNLKAFYAGNLDIPYIDWRIFKEVISRNSEVDFILAGPWLKKEVKEDIQSFSNTYYVGSLKTEEVKYYCIAADLLLLFYRADEFPEQLSNSHKMMEYLSSGKMIVATKTQEYIKLVEEGLFLMAKENMEYPQLFKYAIQELASWNSRDKQQARQAFAMENTYDKQIDRIESLISTYEPPC